jgi:lipoate-protein ligase A
MGTCRVVIESEPRDGVLNMALDEALLEEALSNGECTVRWYRWDTATVSLGYFQAADAAALADLAELPMVRRLTGGGAILHHHEWTYSCSVPPGHRLAEIPTQIYDRVHERVVAALAEQGIQASLRGEALSEREGQFLCFGRGDPRDIIFRGHKILGSAQRRRRGAILQHGSLLIRRSDRAPQFPGLLDLVPEEQDFDAALNGQFIHGLGASIGSQFAEVELCSSYGPAIEQRVQSLVPKYQTLTWARR